jgi:hypothetical protein
MKTLTTIYIKLYEVLETDKVVMVSTDVNGYFAIVDRLIDVIEEF